MTLAEYFETPETLLPQEFIDGVVRVADAPFVSHQRVVLKLAFALQRYAEPEGLGEVIVSPVDVIFDPDRALVLQPDLLFVSRERSPIVRDRIHGAPDLVVEVLSPRPRIGTLRERLRWFAQYGVREIWTYNQVERQMHVLPCASGTIRESFVLRADDRMRSEVLPGFTLKVASVV